jgi:hypothetical protein
MAKYEAQPSYTTDEWHVGGRWFSNQYDAQAYADRMNEEDERSSSGSSGGGGYSSGGGYAYGGRRKGNILFALAFGVISGACIAMLVAWAAAGYFGDTGAARNAFIIALLIVFIVSFMAWRKKAGKFVLLLIALSVAGAYVSKKQPEFPLRQGTVLPGR